MKNTSENEYKIYKNLAEFVQKEIKKPLEKAKRNVQAKYEKMQRLSKEISNAEDIGQINKLSIEFDKLKIEFLSDLALAASLDSINEKNVSRVKYIDGVLSNAGIYSDSADKKELKNLMSKISKTKFNENVDFSAFDLKKSYIVFFNGELFEIFNGKLDFSREINKQVLKNNTDIALEMAIKNYPESISTIEASELLNIKLKKKLLKKIAFFVYDNHEKLSFEKINKALGNILNLSLGKGFVLAIEDVFNGRIIDFLKQNNQELETIIDVKLHIGG